VVTMKNIVFWYVTLCGLLFEQTFRGTCSLQLQGGKDQLARNNVSSNYQTQLRLFQPADSSYPEDWEYTFLRNVSSKETHGATSQKISSCRICLKDASYNSQECVPTNISVDRREADKMSIQEQVLRCSGNHNSSTKLI
jgi:hypothetical protein